MDTARGYGFGREGRAARFPTSMVDTAVRKRPRARYVVAAVVCGLVVIWMLMLLQRNVVYLEPVSEAVAERERAR